MQQKGEPSARIFSRKSQAAGFNPPHMITGQFGQCEALCRRDCAAAKHGQFEMLEQVASSSGACNLNQLADLEFGWKLLRIEIAGFGPVTNIQLMPSRVVAEHDALQPNRPLWRHSIQGEVS